jgi:putative transposase
LPEALWRKSENNIPADRITGKPLAHTSKSSLNAQSKGESMSYWRLFYHAVWSTQDRQPLIDPIWEKDLYGYLWGKATALDCIPHAINGMPDHLHAALSIPPRLSVADTIGQLKGASSHWINEQHPGSGFAWQGEYSVFSISESVLDEVVGYIAAQKKHHADLTMIDMLEKISQ